MVAFAKQSHRIYQICHGWKQRSTPTDSGMTFFVQPVAVTPDKACQSKKSSKYFFLGVGQKRKVNFVSRWCTSLFPVITLTLNSDISNLQFSALSTYSVTLAFVL